MEMFHTLCLLLGISFNGGIRVYGTVAGLGLAHQRAWIDLPGNMEILSHPWVIGVASVLYLAETVGDKVPWINMAVDQLQNFVKPIVMGIIAYMMIPESNAVAQVAAGVGAGSVSLTTHMANGILRGPTKGDPVSNTVGSVAEDAGFLGGMWLLMTHPVLLAVVVIAFLIVAIWILRRAARTIKGIFQFFRRKPTQS